MELTKEELAKVDLDVKNGKTYTEIGRDFNTTKESIKLQLLNNGYKLTNHEIPSYLTNEVINKIKELNKGGLSINAISKQLNLGNNKTLKINLLQLGVEIFDNSEAYFSPEKIKLMIKTHSEGASLVKLKEVLNVGHDVLVKMMEKHNLKPNNETRTIYENEDKLRELHSQGLHNSAIGKLMNFDHKVVDKALKKLQLTPNVFDGTRKLTQQEKEIIIQRHHVEKVPYTYLAIEMGMKDKVFKRECEKNGIKLYNRGVVDLTKEELTEIIRLNTEEEHGFGMLCEKFGYTTTYLSNQLEKNGVTLKRYMHGQRTTFTEDETKQIVELNHQGYSKEYIAEQFNTTQETLTKIIKRNDLNFIDNRFSNVTDELFETIKHRNDNGEGINKIADDLKLSHKTLVNEFKKRSLNYKTYTPFFNKETGIDDGFLHYPSELINNLIHDYTDNELSIRKLCEKYSLNKKTLRRNLLHNGVKLREYNVILTDDEVKEIIKLYNAGNSVKSISKLFNCNHHIISKVLKNNDIQVIDKRIYQFTEKETQDIIRKYVTYEYDGETIGRIYNIPGITILKHLKLNGVETRPSNSSVPERLINRFVKGFIDKDVLSNPRGFISSGEVDVLSHKYKIGIEYNGLLWHSDKFAKGQNVNYHLDKTNEVEANGYKLIHIFEDEYRNREYLIFNKILEVFNVDKYVGSDFNYYKMLDFKTSEEFLLNVDSLYQLKDKVVVDDVKIENTTNIEDVLVNKLSLEITPDYDKLFYLKSNNKKVGVITVKGKKLKEVLINPCYKVSNLESLISGFIKENNIKCVVLDRRWYSETNNIFKGLPSSVIETEPKRFYVKGYKRYNVEQINVEHYKTHYLHKRKYKEGMTDDDFLAKCNVFSIYDCGYFTYNF